MRELNPSFFVRIFDKLKDTNMNQIWSKAIKYWLCEVQDPTLLDNIMDECKTKSKEKPILDIIRDEISSWYDEEDSQELFENSVKYAWDLVPVFDRIHVKCTDMFDGEFEVLDIPFPVLSQIIVNTVDGDTILISLGFKFEK